MPSPLAERAPGPPAELAQSASFHPRRLALDALAIALGAATTLAIYGYRFGESNQTVYLLDAMRQANPDLLRNDWFTTQTLQYHALFGRLAAILMRGGAIEPAFATIYLVLVILFHVAWLGIVRALTGARAAYVLAVALYYVSAAGTGLGMYQFFQDSSLLPSNIANVAILWGFYLWIARRFIRSGACFGIAGIFHLNHALIGMLVWIALCSTIRGARKQLIIGSIAALAPSIINIILAMNGKLPGGRSMPLPDFIDIYVRLRHPHHYDPASWNIGIWIAFAWSLPFAAILKPPARAIVAILAVLQVIALVAAGVWFVNETLVQLSLYRFSIYLQLLGCVGAAMLISRRIPGWVGPVACATMIAICLVRGPFFGFYSMPRDDPEYLALCDWARTHTPSDAVFLVPPGESSFRLRARRAIVVNYKGVPQLSGELREWVDRMSRVLALDDLRSLPRGYPRTLAAINERFASLSDDQLIDAARQAHARFIVLSRPMKAATPAFSTAGGRFFLYDLEQKELRDGTSGAAPAASGATRPARQGGDD